MAHFDEVYDLFVRLLQSSFRLAEKPDLAERLSLRLARRSSIVIVVRYATNHRLSVVRKHQDH